MALDAIRNVDTMCAWKTQSAMNPGHLGNGHEPVFQNWKFNMTLLILSDKIILDCKFP